MIHTEKSPKPQQRNHFCDWSLFHITHIAFLETKIRSIQKQSSTVSTSSWCWDIQLNITNVILMMVPEKKSRGAPRSEGFIVCGPGTSAQDVTAVNEIFVERLGQSGGPTDRRNIIGVPWAASAAKNNHSIFFHRKFFCQFFFFLLDLTTCSLSLYWSRLKKKKFDWWKAYELLSLLHFSQEELNSAWQLCFTACVDAIAARCPCSYDNLCCCHY